MAPPVFDSLHPLSSLPLWLLPVALLASLIIYTFYQVTLHPLSSIPGPFWARLSRLWLVHHSRAGDMPYAMIDLHAKHGSLVRTGPSEVSVSDPTAIKAIYGPGTKFRKSEWYSVWQGHRKFDLFPERNERLHGEQRRLVSRIYSMDALRDLEPYVDDGVKVFVECMEERRGEVLDLGTWVQLFAFDVIGEVTFSKRFGFMDAGGDDGSFKSLEGILHSASWLGQVPAVYWIHDRLMPYIGNHLGVNMRHSGLRQFAVREITARQDRGSDHSDILSKLFAVNKEKPTLFDTDAVTSMTTSNINAGSDTTAISTRAVIYYLLKNPAAKRALIAEIDAKRKSGTLSSPAKLAEADAMPYLQAVMYEALRLHPAVGMALPRVVPEGGAQVAGTYLPAGTTVGANPWVVHRDQAVFGEDVDAFRPERWMGGDTGDMHRFFFAFGAGARMCLGRNIAWMEMSKLIPTLFMHFDLSLGDPKAEWTTKCWWFVLQKGLRVRLTRRVQ